MRVLRKVTAVAMASAMVVSMAGCGGGAKETTAAATEAPTTAAN